MGAWEQIVDFTATSAITEVNFTNLNISKDDYIKVAGEINNTGSQTEYYQCFANGTGSYSTQIFIGADLNLGVTRNSRPDTIRGSAGERSFFNTTFKLTQSGHFVGISSSNVAINSQEMLFFIKHITSTTTFNDVSSLLFTRRAGRNNIIGVGSRIKIYKLKAKKVADIITTNNSTSIEIDSLNIKKSDSYLLLSDVNSGSNSEIDLLFDNKTIGNFRTNRAIVVTTSNSAVRAKTSPIIMNVSSNNRAFAETYISVSNFSTPVYQTKTIRNVGTTSVAMELNGTTYDSQDVNEISSLTIQSNTTNGIGSGSRFELYKLYEGGN